MYSSTNLPLGYLSTTATSAYLLGFYLKIILEISFIAIHNRLCLWLNTQITKNNASLASVWEHFILVLFYFILLNNHDYHLKNYNVPFNCKQNQIYCHLLSNCRYCWVINFNSQVFGLLSSFAVMTVVEDGGGFEMDMELVRIMQCQSWPIVQKNTKNFILSFQIQSLSRDKRNIIFLVRHSQFIWAAHADVWNE